MKKDLKKLLKRLNNKKPDLDLGVVSNLKKKGIKVY
jgi:hypothetical protein